MSIIKSYTEAILIDTGWINAEIPKMNRRLKILEPITFPIAIPVSPFLAATADVTSSGRDVPIATIVSPISVSVIPAALAISFALFTTTCPPAMISASPITIYNKHFHIGSLPACSSSVGFFLAFKTRKRIYPINITTRIDATGRDTTATPRSILYSAKCPLNNTEPQDTSKSNIVVMIATGKSRFNTIPSTGRG